LKRGIEKAIAIIAGQIDKKTGERGKASWISSPARDRRHDPSVGTISANNDETIGRSLPRP